MMNLKMNEMMEVFELLSNDEKVETLKRCASQRCFNSDVEWFKKACNDTELTNEDIEALMQYAKFDNAIIYSLDCYEALKDYHFTSMIREIMMEKIDSNTSKTIDERLAKYINLGLVEYCKEKHRLYRLPLSIQQEHKKDVIKEIKWHGKEYYYRYESFCVENDIMKEWFKTYTFLDDMPLDDILDDMTYIDDIAYLREYIAQMLPNADNGATLSEVYKYIDTDAEIYIVDNLVDEWLDAHSEYADCEYLDYDKIERDMMYDYNECITMNGYIMII